MLRPVSPQTPSASIPPGDADSDDRGEVAHAQEEEEEEIDTKQAMTADPIVGTQLVAQDEHGPGALTPRGLSSPPPMTPAERAVHNPTHLPYHLGCPIRAATRRTNSMHLRSHEHLRVVPLLGTYYCFIRFIDGQTVQPILVMRLYPYKR